MTDLHICIMDAVLERQRWISNMLFTYESWGLNFMVVNKLECNHAKDCM